MTETRCCATCKWHEPDNETRTGRYYCLSDKSAHCGEWTTDEWSCGAWELGHAHRKGKPSLREALLEGDWSDMTTAQIAQALGSTTKSVSTYLLKLAREGHEVPHRKAKCGRKPATATLQGAEAAGETPEPEWTKLPEGAAILGGDAAEDDARADEGRPDNEPEEGISKMETTTRTQEDKYTLDYGAGGVSCEAASEAGRLIAETSRANETADGGTVLEGLEVHYAIGPSDETPPVEGWMDEAPAPASGMYIWGKWVMVFADGSKADAPNDPWLCWGQDGITAPAEDEAATVAKMETVGRAECLARALDCVCGARQEDYGTPEDSFDRIARLWSAWRGEDYTPQDVAAMMALLKLARIGSGRATVDSWVDLAGYAACGCEITTTREG